jgi:hypothetical protein
VSDEYNEMIPWKIGWDRSILFFDGIYMPLNCSCRTLLVNKSTRISRVQWISCMCVLLNPTIIIAVVCIHGLWIEGTGLWFPFCR